MAFRSRSGKALPPDQRPYRYRFGARVVVRSQGKVLLLRDSDDGIAGSSWWTTPGGGIDDGETAVQAAVRELGEEVGLEVAAADLRGPIATRVVTHGYSDEILVQHETFYALDVSEPFLADHSGFTEREKVGITASGWFTMEQVAGLVVWPRNLAELFASDGSGVLELGAVEESSVPLSGEACSNRACE